MIALTDTAVKNMIQSRFGVPAIFSSENVALEERGDIQYQLPTGLIEADGSISTKVKFPFCIWIRGAGSINEDSFNISLARDGTDIGFRNEDGTKARFVKAIPITYPYTVRYYVASVAQAIRLEKLYWGLRTEFTLSIYYPPHSDDRLKEFTVYIPNSSLSGFDPPTTDQIYAKGKYYAGNMNFSVSTWIVEGVDVPIIQNILINTYDQSTLDALDDFEYNFKIWS